MHKLLRLVILAPDKIRAKLANTDTPLAQQVLALTRLDPFDLFLAIINSWSQHNNGASLVDPPPQIGILVKELVTGFTTLDDLYYQIAELYKEAVGKVPPTRSEYIITGSPLTIKCTTKPLVILNPKHENGTLTIDPKELSVTVFYI